MILLTVHNESWKEKAIGAGEMSDSRETEIQQEIENISKDIKSIMKKVEELYPKKQASEKDEIPEKEKTSDTDDKPEN